MAKTGDLVFKNTSGSTKSNYSLIDDIATAVERASEKGVHAVYSDDATFDAVDGTSYFINPGGNNITITLPEAAESAGFKMFVKQIGAGSIKIARFTGDKINGVVSDVDLATVNDYQELVGVGADGYYTKYGYID